MRIFLNYEDFIYTQVTDIQKGRVRSCLLPLSITTYWFNPSTATFQALVAL